MTWYIWQEIRELPSLALSFILLNEFEFEFWCLTPLSAIFQLYHGDITKRSFTTFLIIQLYVRVSILLNDSLQHFWSSSYMWGLAYYWTILYNISDHPVICEGWHITVRSFTTFLIIQLYVRVCILLSDPLQHFWSSSYIWGLAYYSHMENAFMTASYNWEGGFLGLKTSLTQVSVPSTKVSCHVYVWAVSNLLLILRWCPIWNLGLLLAMCLLFYFISILPNVSASVLMRYICNRKRWYYLTACREYIRWWICISIFKDKNIGTKSKYIYKKIYS